VIDRRLRPASVLLKTARPAAAYRVIGRRRSSANTVPRRFAGLKRLLRQKGQHRDIDAGRRAGAYPSCFCIQYVAHVLSL
jgi:hypothetical protein